MNSNKRKVQQDIKLQKIMEFQNVNNIEQSIDQNDEESL